jgi:hypothetical protein
MFNQACFGNKYNNGLKKMVNLLILMVGICFLPYSPSITQAIVIFLALFELIP